MVPPGSGPSAGVAPGNACRPDHRLHLNVAMVSLRFRNLCDVPLGTYTTPPAETSYSSFSAVMTSSPSMTMKDSASWWSVCIGGPALAGTMASTMERFPPVSAALSSHAHHQFDELERFSQVVVGASAEACDRVVEAARGGEHQDPAPRTGLGDAAAHIVAVNHRKVAIEDDDVGVIDRQPVQGDGDPPTPHFAGRWRWPRPPAPALAPPLTSSAASEPSRHAPHLVSIRLPSPRDDPRSGQTLGEYAICLNRHLCTDDTLD